MIGGICFGLFPLVQLPKKFRAENLEIFWGNLLQFSLVQLPKKFRDFLPYCLGEIAKKVSISSTSEEVQSSFSFVRYFRLLVSISSTSEEVQSGISQEELRVWDGFH